MNFIEAVVLGIIQGLTEFLPVSSSGHLELGKYLMKINPEKSLIFTVVVHGATVLSTMVVFWKDIWQILKGLFKFELNDETLFVLRLLYSMVPVLIVGLFFIDEDVFIMVFSTCWYFLLAARFVPRILQQPVYTNHTNPRTDRFNSSKAL